MYINYQNPPVLLTLCYIRGRQGGLADATGAMLSHKYITSNFPYISLYSHNMLCITYILVSMRKDKKRGTWWVQKGRKRLGCREMLEIEASLSTSAPIAIPIYSAKEEIFNNFNELPLP